MGAQPAMPGMPDLSGLQMKQQLAMHMLQGMGDTSPTSSPYAALARAIMPIAGGFELSHVNKQLADYSDGAVAEWTRIAHSDDPLAAIEQSQNPMVRAAAPQLAQSTIQENIKGQSDLRWKPQVAAAEATAQNPALDARNRNAAQYDTVRVPMRQPDGSVGFVTMTKADFADYARSQRQGGDQAPSLPAVPDAPQELHPNVGGDEVLGSGVDATRMAESRGDPNAVSPVGARGTMQTMPGTLRDPGYGVRPAQNDTPQELDRVGRDYLGALTQHYGSSTVAHIAYNWGPGNTDAWLKNGAHINQLPAETRQYLLQTGINQATHHGAPGPGGARETSAAPAQQTAQQQPYRQSVPSSAPEPGAHPITEQEKAAYPGAVGIDEHNHPIYAPASAAGGQMSDETVEFLAKYAENHDGRLPPGFSRSPSIVSRIMQRVTEHGIDPMTLPGIKASIAADSKALADQTVTYHRIEGFAQAAANAGKMALQLAPAATGGSSPYLNKPIQWWQEHMKGTLPQASFGFAMQTLGNEYARVMSGGTGNVALTDSARNDAYEQFSTAQTPEQLQARIQTMMQEIAIRTDAMRGQIAELRGNLHLPPQGEGAPGQQGQQQGQKPSYTFNPATGQLE